MAKRKKAEDTGIKAEWINTFADLMNLLLCFFVLLFALSTVDGEKFEKVSISMANSIGVFEAGSTAFGTQELISGGASQLSNLDEFFTSMGKTVQGTEDPSQMKNTEQGIQGSMGAKGVTDDYENSDGTQGQEGAQEAGTTEGNDNTEDKALSSAIKTIQEKQYEVTAGMYDTASDLKDQYQLNDYVDIQMDSKYQYLLLTLRGSILFESGSAEIKSDAKPILRNVGDLLKHFNGYNIEIVGHTDNVPVASSTFKDNNWLSVARALNATEFLVENSDLEPSMIKYSGRGEFEPVSSNSTAIGRALNRRIEIKVYNQYSGE